MSATVAVENDIASRIICQPSDKIDLCAYYAIINLYVKCGLEPPTIERMLDIWSPRPGGEGIGTLEQMAVLMELGFPSMVALGIIPRGLTARDVFPPLLDVGISLLVGIQYKSMITPEGAVILGDADFADMPVIGTHVVVPFEHSSEGFNAIWGWENIKTDWLPWKTMPMDAPGQRFGLFREFVLTWPIEFNERRY